MLSKPGPAHGPFEFGSLHLLPSSPTLVVIAASVALTGWPELLFPSWPPSKDPTVEALDYGAHFPEDSTRWECFTGSAPSSRRRAGYKRGKHHTRSVRTRRCSASAPIPTSSASCTINGIFLDRTRSSWTGCRPGTNLVDRYAPYFESVTWVGSVIIRPLRRTGVPRSVSTWATISSAPYPRLQCRRARSRRPAARCRLSSPLPIES